MHRRDLLHILALVFTGATFRAPISAFAYNQSDSPEPYSFRVLRTFPHDPDAFTQGLLYHEGFLYESTGGWGTSSIRRVDLETGRVLDRRNLPRHFFGEGLALWENRLIQLTWRSGTGFIYDLKTLDMIRRFHYSGEGWGLTQDLDGLIMSDGSSELRRLNPRTLRELNRLTVHDRGLPLAGLNELEYIDGEIWANVFPTKRIVRIDPAAGNVIGSLSLQGIIDGHPLPCRESVANGIAWDSHGKRILVTGKHWPMLFEIAVTPGAP